MNTTGIPLQPEMSIFCAISGLLQFVILVALTGVLVSVAAVSRLMEVTVSLVYPIAILMLNRSGKLIIQLELLLTDLNMKFPCLRYVLRPQYTPYLNTAGTVLLGWLIVSWVSYVVWSFLAPLAIAIVAVILICPTTAKWCVNQTVPAFELFLNEYLDKCQAFLSRIHA